MQVALPSIGREFGVSVNGLQWIVTTIARAIPLRNEVQHKVKQKMGESSWQGLMQRLGEFLKVTDQLANQDESEDLRKTEKM